MNEQETGGKLPSSKANASTVKHLQVLSGGPLWPFSLDISAMDPPNYESSGVFGIEGAEGALTISYVSIPSFKLIKLEEKEEDSSSVLSLAVYIICIYSRRIADLGIPRGSR